MLYTDKIIVVIFGLRDRKRFPSQEIKLAAIHGIQR
jgi:hypothetical protein